MRKVFDFLAAMAFALGLNAAAVAGPGDRPELQALHEATEVTPFQYARIERTADGRFKVGRWRPYDSHTRGEDCSDGLAWDAYIPNRAAGNWNPHQHLSICPNGWGGSGWAETSAWYFGPLNSNPHFANEMTYAPGTGGCARELALAWFWNPIPPFDDPNCRDFMFVGILTNGNPTTDCTPPVEGGAGWIFDFGCPMESGYFFSHMDPGCSDPNVFWNLGTSGRGGYEVILAQNVTPDPNDPNFVVITFANRAQPMLWATSHDDAFGSPNPDWALVGSTDVNHWNDGFPYDPNMPTVDGVFDPVTECVPYGPFALPNGQCPEPYLSSMIVFGYSNDCPIDPCGNACPGPGCNSAGVDADFNDDCTVGLPDLSILLTSFGGAGTCAQGDTNNNGSVQLDDLSNLLARFGTNCN